MHTPSDIRQAIRDYILGAFLTNRDADSFRDDDDLLATLDSLQVLRMLLDLEERYSIKVETSELSPENLGSVENLSAFITRKRQERAC